MGEDFVVLLLEEVEVGDEEEASFRRELNSLDNSSAVAIDAFRSSFMDWTEGKTVRETPQKVSTVHTLL